MCGSETRIIQIQDRDGNEIGLIKTNMKDKELKESFEKIRDPEGIFEISCFERFEEYASELEGRFCDRFYIDDIMEVERECQI